MSDRRSASALFVLAISLGGFLTASSPAAPVSELDKLKQGLQKPVERERIDAIMRWNGPAVDAVKAAEIIVGALSDKSQQVREAAAGALVKIGEKSALPLTKALQHPETSVRKQALKVYEQLGVKGKQGAEAVAKLMVGSGDAQRQEAQRALVGMGPTVVPIVVGLLKINDAQQKFVPDILRQMGPAAQKEAVPALMELAKDKDALARRGAATVLGSLGADAKPALPLLAAMIRDPDQEVRVRAVAALVRFNQDGVPHLLEQLKNTDERQHWAAITNLVIRLAPQGQTLPPGLAAVFVKHMEHKDAAVRAATLQVLQPLAFRAKELAGSIAPLLGDKDGDVKNLAVKLLTPMNTDIIPVLLKQFKNPSEDVRLGALTFLTRYAYRSREMVNDLAPLLADSNAKIRLHTAEMLRQSQSSESLWPLTTALADEKVEVRRSAALSLQTLSYLPLPATSPYKEKGVNALIRASNDTEAPIRNIATLILRKAGPDPAVSLALLRTKDVQTRTMGATLIATSGKTSKEALPLLAEGVKSDNLPLRTAGLNALIKLLPESQPVVKELLTGKDPAIRLATAKAMQKPALDKSDSVLNLLVVALKDTDVSVREAAGLALAKIGPAALPALADAAKAGDLGMVKVLAKLGKPGTAFLVELTGHKDLPVRLAAIDALGDVRPMSQETAAGLRKLLEDRQVEVRNAAMKILIRTEFPGIEGKEFLFLALREKDWHTRKAAGQKLVRLRGLILPDLIELAEKDANAAARAEAIHTIGMMGSAAVPAVKPLIDLVRSDKAENQPLRIHALAALDKMHPEADAALLGILVDGDPAPQVAVLEMLRVEQVNLGKELVIELLRSKNAEVSSAAARALAKLGPNAAMEVAPLLADKEGEVRAAALQAMESFATLETLAKCLRDDKLVVRETASRALAKRGAGAHGVLAEALRSKDFRVQVAAANAIVPVRDRADELVPILVDIVLARGARDLELQAAARAIRRINPVLAARLLADRAPVPELVVLLKKPQPEVQELACLALAELGLPSMMKGTKNPAAEALPALTDLLKQNRTDVIVLAAAARAVNALSPREKGQNEDAAQRLAPDLAARLVKGTHEKSILLREEIMASLQHQLSSQGPNNGDAILAALQLGQLTDDANHWLAHFANFGNMTEEPGANFGTMTEEASPNYVRMLALYHGGNKNLPPRLTPAAELALKEQFFRFLTDRGSLTMPPPIEQVKTTLPINLLRGTTSTYIALDVLKDDPLFKERTLQGRTLQELYQTWTAWWREWAKERALQGMWSEMGLPDHQMLIWPCLLNMHDCTSDAVVKQRFKMLLDLTAIEEEQISVSGVRAGRRGKKDGVGCGLDQWKDVLQGEQPRRLGEPCYGLSGIVWTSGYQLPPAAILLRKLNRPVAHYGITNQHFYGGNVFAHVTPHYVLGCQLSQPVGTMEMYGTWHRLVFDDMNALFCPLPAPGERRHVQHKDVYIATCTGAKVVRQSIRITPGLTKVEKAGWMFVSNGPAFAAIFVEGGYDLEKGAVEKVDAKSPARAGCDALVFKEAGALIVLQAGDVHKFGSFEKFQEAILNAPLVFGKTSLQYTGPQSVAIEFFRDAMQPPLIAGPPPGDVKMIYDSPYLQGRAGQPQITVRVGSYAAVYDFDGNTVKEDKGK